MKTIRSMVLVSGDPVSLERGAQQVHAELLKTIEAYGLSDEINVTLVGDLGRHDALPLVVVYPEAAIYGPVKPENVAHLVEEHLYKGRIATALLAARRELSGWIRARHGEDAVREYAARRLRKERQVFTARFGADGVTIVDPNRAQEGAAAVFQKIYDQPL